MELSKQKENLAEVRKNLDYDLAPNPSPQYQLLFGCGESKSHNNFFREQRKSIGEKGNLIDSDKKSMGSGKFKSDLDHKNLQNTPGNLFRPKIDDDNWKNLLKLAGSKRAHSGQLSEFRFTDRSNTESEKSFLLRQAKAVCDKFDKEYLGKLRYSNIEPKVSDSHQHIPCERASESGGSSKLVFDANKEDSLKKNQELKHKTDDQEPMAFRTFKDDNNKSLAEEIQKKNIISRPKYSSFYNRFRDNIDKSAIAVQRASD